MGFASVLATMDISVDTAWQIFQLLDASCSHTIAVGDFVEGCLRLQGNAKSVDIHLLRHQSNVTWNRLAALLKYFEEDFLVDVREQVAKALAAQGSFMCKSSESSAQAQALPGIPCYSL